MTIYELIETASKDTLKWLLTSQYQRLLDKFERQLAHDRMMVFIRIEKEQNRELLRRILIEKQGVHNE